MNLNGQEERDMEALLDVGYDKMVDLSKFNELVGMQTDEIHNHRGACDHHQKGPKLDR